ncbi:hypothetical protein FRC01_007759 [Tulasnella sp. 417]|nr:hypothetical protein FRC01_007759 [Tulasnella sp. 417]
MSGNTESGAKETPANSIVERLKSFSLTILTTLTAEGVFTTLPHDAREEIIIVVDEIYVNQLNKEERRYFLVCPNHATHTVVSNTLRSNLIAALPRVKISFWADITTKIEKGEVYGKTSSVPSDQQAGLGEEFVDSFGESCRAERQLASDVPSVTTAGVPLDGPEGRTHAQPQLATNTPFQATDAVANPPRRVIYATARVDTITTLIVKFAQAPLSSLIALHMSKITSTSTPATGSTSPLLDLLGPTGKPSCLHSIIHPPSPWTRRSAHSAQKTASQEVKTLKREFCEKYQALADRCTNDPQHTLTLDQVMAIVNSIEDRYARRKWMANHIREMRRLNKDVNEMVLEYLALMAHCRKLQKACIAAANEAYDVNIVLIPDPFFPIPTPP